MLDASFARQISLARRGITNYFLKWPFAISFEVTHCCNAKCRHCHLGGSFKENRASPERFGQICRQIKPLVAQASGGEPLLRRDLEKIIEAWRVPNRSPFIFVTTNASLLTHDRYTSLREAGVDEFSVSLDYPDERHDEFRGIPGLFGKISDLIHRLDERGKTITLCCVVQSDNFRDLVDVAELALRWQVNLNFSTYTTLRTRNKDLMLSPQETAELREVVERLLAFKKTYNTIQTSEYAFRRMIEFFEYGRMPDCRTGIKFCNVNPDGTFSPCGLIITDYRSREDLIENFAKNNTCAFCTTSIRSNTERPLKYLFSDSLDLLKQSLKPARAVRHE